MPSPEATARRLLSQITMHAGPDHALHYSRTMLARLDVFDRMVLVDLARSEKERMEGEEVGDFDPRRWGACEAVILADAE